MTVGGIPSSFPSPEYINMATECISPLPPKSLQQQKDSQRSSDRKKDSMSADIKKEETNLTHKNKNEYLNMNFEQSVAYSERTLDDASRSDAQAINKGNSLFLVFLT